MMRFAFGKVQESSHDEEFEMPLHNPPQAFPVDRQIDGPARKWAGECGRQGCETSILGGRKPSPGRCALLVLAWSSIALAAVAQSPSPPPEDAGPLLLPRVGPPAKGLPQFEAIDAALREVKSREALERLKDEEGRVAANPLYRGAWVVRRAIAEQRAAIEIMRSGTGE